MAVNVLKTKELLELSLLKCKTCGGRLQSPVLQVGVFGNVCGVCCERSVYTDVVRNVDLEALLQKLYLPCNYAERGCGFEGIFDDVCRHEKRCPRRKKECPLAYYNQCENGFKYIDMIEHMKSVHPDNVVTAVGNYVSIKNPVKSNEDVFYLLQVDYMNFMLRARLDVNTGHVLYAFYSLNYYLDIRGVKLSIVVKSENTVFNTENVYINRLEKGDELPYEFNEKDATKLKLSVLETFECVDKITIKVNAEKSLKVGKVDTKSVETSSFGRRCTKCMKISKSIYYCRSYGLFGCDSCCTNISSSYCKCSNSLSASHHVLIKLDDIKSKSSFACTNIGCNEEISCDYYDVHTKSECRFRQLNCPFLTSTSCKWIGPYANLTYHIATDHTDRLNQHSCEISNSTGSTGQLCFIKKNNTFMQTYKISKDQLVVTTKKLDTSDYGDGYKWQIYFKHPVKGYETVISDIFSGDECGKSIDIKGFASNDPFTLQVLFRKINAVPS